MRQNCAFRIGNPGSCVVVLFAVAASLGGGCAGEIGDRGPSSGGQNDAGVGGPKVGAPGEIEGEGGAGGTSPGGTGGAASPGTGGVMAPADAGAGTGGSPAPATGDLVHGLSVTDVAIYQAVKVSLVKTGQPVSMPSAPLIRNRPALVRVFVTPDAGWQARTVVARLQWGSAAPKEAMATIAAASTDPLTNSTFNFQLAATDMTAQVPWSISLLEAPGGTGAGATTGAKIPADGSLAMLGTLDSGASLKIAFVPIRNNNTLPDTSAAQIKFLTDAMFATYPVAKIETTVRDPIDFPSPIAAMGTGWDAALNQVCMTRQTDKPARNVFYYGLVTPGPFQTYCAGGCVEGIAVLASNPNQDFMRCSMGIGYTNMGSGVFLQEVAHSMGRSHAPCGQPAQPDRMYPYAGAKIGVWGYDLVRQRLIDPARTVDFMSYCAPVWISDYTFGRLLPWIQAVNALAPAPFISPGASSPELAASSSGGWPSGPAYPSASAAATAFPADSTLRFPPARWRVATVESDGGVLWGPLVDFDEIAGGTSHTVVIRDGNGQSSTVSGLLFPHTGTGGGMLLLPATVPARAGSVQIGAGTTFRNVRVDN